MRKIVGKVGGHFAKHLFLPNLEATCYVVADYGVEQPVDIVLGVALVLQFWEAACREVFVQSILA